MVSCRIIIQEVSDSPAHRLKDVSGVAYPGTMLALLGESGAGKTSLLDTLAGRKTVGVLHGQILVNGEPRAEDWRRVSGYCMQVHTRACVCRESERVSLLIHVAG